MLKHLSSLLPLKNRWRVHNSPVFTDVETVFANQNIFDLSNLNVGVSPSELTLVSMPFGQGADPTEPQIQSFVLRGGIALEPQKDFVNSTQSALMTQRDKPTIVIDQPAYLLPYYSNQFGHFTGEILSALITFLKILPDGPRRLFVVCPNEFDAVVSRHSNHKKWEKINALTALQSHIQFTDAIPLPRLGQWQNLVLGQKLFGNLKSGNQPKYERVFLTSERSSRIANIEEVVHFLKKNHFYILNSKKYDFERNVITIRDARHLLSEHGSIIHNILFGRRERYSVLCAKEGLKLTNYQFASGGIYAMIHFDQIKFLPCDTADQNLGSGHPWANQLQVDMKMLENHVNKLDG